MTMMSVAFLSLAASAAISAISLDFSAIPFFLLCARHASRGSNAVYFEGGT